MLLVIVFVGNQIVTRMATQVRLTCDSIRQMQTEHMTPVHATTHSSRNSRHDSFRFLGRPCPSASCLRNLCSPKCLLPTRATSSRPHLASFVSCRVRPPFLSAIMETPRTSTATRTHASRPEACLPDSWKPFFVHSRWQVTATIRNHGIWTTSNAVSNYT
jgi:hypothetical protein